MNKLEEYLQKIKEEYLKANKKFPPFHSTHEGYAVLKEEVDELWDGIKANAFVGKLESEAIQVSAMALRFLIDCCKQQSWYD